MVKTKTRKYQRLGAIMMTILMILTILPLNLLPTLNVSAATGSVTKIDKIYHNTAGASFVSNPIPGTRFNASESGFWKMYVNGEVAYCTEYHVSSSTGDGLTSTNLNNRINTDAQRRLALALSFGYNPNTASNGSWEYYGYGDLAYVATQIMVWQIVEGTYGTGYEERVLSTLADATGGGKQAVLDVYHSMKNHVETAMQSNPFNGRTVSLTWNQARGTYCATLSDSSGVAYNNYNYSNNGNLHVEFANANTLLIETQPSGKADFANANYIISASSKGAAYNGSGVLVNGSFQAWTAGNKQDFVTFTPRYDPIQASISVWVEAGILDLYKTADDNNIGGKQFRIVGQNTGYTATLTTDGNGRTTVRVPVDTYTVTEINVESKYDPQPASQVINVTAAGPSDSNYTKVNFHNKLKNFQVVVNKTDGNGKNLKAGFSVFDANGNVVKDINGNEVFYTNASTGTITSGYYNWQEGLYVKEVDAPDGYIADETQTSVPESAAGGTVTVNSVNPPGEWSVKILKVDENNPEKKLENVTFEIRDESTDEILASTTGQTQFTTDSNGEVLAGPFDYEKYGNTRYYFYEVNTPSEKDSKGNSYVRAFGDERDTWFWLSDEWLSNPKTEVAATITVENPPDVPIEVSVFKYDKESGESSPLSGAEFTVTAGGEEHVIVTESDGYATLTGISSKGYGEVTIEETKAPNGYVRFTEVATIPDVDHYDTTFEKTYTALNGSECVVTAHYDSAENVFKIEYRLSDDTETVGNYEFGVRKVDQNGNPLEGVEFALYSSSLYGDLNEMLGTAITDSNGVATFKIDISSSVFQNFGYSFKEAGSGTLNAVNMHNVSGVQWNPLAVVETKAPDGYPEPVIGTSVKDSSNAQLFSLFCDYNYYPSGLGGSAGYNATCYIAPVNNNGAYGDPDKSGIEYQVSKPNQSIVIKYSSPACVGEFASYLYSFTMTNKKSTGSLNGLKVAYSNANTQQPLSGVKIGLWQVDSTDEEAVRTEIANEAPYDTTLTNEEKPYNFSFTELPVGNYAAQEISSTGNYVLSDEVFIFTVDEDNETNTFNWTLLNYIPIEINGTKVDSETHEPLAGATIELYQIDTTCPNCGVNGINRYGFTTCPNCRQSTGYSSVADAPTVKLNETVTSSDGKFSFTTDSEGNLLDPNGYYKIIESEAPVGYEKSDDEFYIMFQNGYCYTSSYPESPTVTFTLENTPVPASVSGVKYESNASGETSALAGAIIGVFNADSDVFDSNSAIKEDVLASLLNADGTVNENVFNQHGGVAYVTTSDDGAYSITGLNSTASYRVIEMKAPSGYNRSTEVFEANFSEYPTPTDAEYSFSHDFYNTIKHVYIEGTKYSVANEGDTIDESKTLNGVTLGLFEESVYNANQNDLENADHQEGVTANGGTFLFDNLDPNGSYVLVELETTADHLLGDDVYHISFKDGVCSVTGADGAAANGDHVTISMKNVKIGAAVFGYKVDEDGNALSGAQFGLFDASETDYSAENVKLDSDGNPFIATSRSDGKFEFQGVPYGNYKVVEISGVANHMLDQTPINVSIDGTNHGQEINIGNVVNKEITGGIKGTKVGEDGSPLAGATFGLYTSQQEIYNFSTATATDRTEADGIFQFDNLAAGTYFVVELEAPAGKVLDSTVHAVVVPEGQTSYTVVDMGELVNETGSGTVEGKKVNGNGEGLQGAKFALFEKPANLTDADPNNDQIDASFFTEANAAKDTLGNALVVVSGSDGSFKFEKVPYGDYILRELEAPSGYDVNTTNYSVAISERGSNTVNVGEIVNTAPGKIYGRKVDENGYGVQGAVLGIYTGRASEVTNPTRDNAYQVVTSGEGGYFEFTVNKTNFYCVYEIEPPAGYEKYTDCIWEQYVPAESSSLSYNIGDVVNYKNTTEISGRKVDESYQPLSGAVFELYNASTNAVVQTSSPTGEDGVFTFTNLTYNVGGNNEYYILEKTAPEGMKKIDGEVWRGNITEEAQTISIGDVVNSTLTGSIYGYKVDGENNRLNGALIGLFPTGTTVFNETTAIQTKTTTSMSGMNGYYAFTGVPYGNYLIAEIQAPEGYEKSDQVIEVTVNQSSVTVTTAIVDSKIKTSIEGYKVDGENNRLNGAVIGLFDASETSYTQENALQTATTANNAGKGDGYYSFLNVSYGNYKIVEIQAPEGYEKSDQVIEVSVTSSAPITAETNLVNNRITSGVEGYKVDGNGDGLNGALIGLFESTVTEYTQQNALQTTTSAHNDVKGDGYYSFTDIPYGTYKVVEIQAPEGYQKSNQVLDVTINSTETVVLQENLVNEKIFGNIEGFKVDDRGNGVNGAVIGLFGEGITDYTQENATMIATTASNPDKCNGYYNFLNVPYGSYQIAEIQAPEGYLMTDQVLEVTINSEDTITLTTRLENPLITGQIEGYKVDGENNKLNGAVFGLFDKDTTDYTEENAIQTTTSAYDDEKGDGYFRFTDVPYGEYKVVEVQAPDNYIASAEIREVEISEMDQLVSLENFVNEKGTGSIIGKKVDGDGNALAGAEITLYASDKQTVIDVATSNAQGVFSFEDVSMGDYYVKETKAPDGFYLDEEFHAVTLSAEGQTPGQAELVITNWTSNELPSSGMGGSDYTPWILGGGIAIMLASAAAVLAAMNKKSTRKTK